MNWALLTTKFFFLESIDRFLLNIGFNSTWADIVTFIIVCIVLLLIAWILKAIGSRILKMLVGISNRMSNHKWVDFLLKRKFYHKLINLVVAVIVVSTSQTLFQGFGQGLTGLIDTVLSIYLVYAGLQVFNALMSTTNDVYETHPQARRKSIRSIVQSAKIFAGVVAAILIISILLNKNPTDLLVALGASAAIISLVFRDTILGFVASIQISAQEMIRPGDWIEMPSRGADGMVSEINVTNVKVRNWDNSVSLLPTYSMVSESFTNWRSMQESDGRRFKRPILVDINSIRVLSDAQIEQISKHPVISPEVSEQMLRIMEQGNSSSFVTNLGLYRCYIEAFLSKHPRVAQNQLSVVRYLDNSESGITIQIYAFSKDKDLVDYERVVADIFENILVAAPLFSLRMYQRPVATPEVDRALIVADDAADGNDKNVS